MLLLLLQTLPTVLKLTICFFFHVHSLFSRKILKKSWKRIFSRKREFFKRDFFQRKFSFFLRFFSFSLSLCRFSFKMFLMKSSFKSQKLISRKIWDRNIMKFPHCVEVTYPCKCANPWVAWRKIVRLSSLKGLVYFPVTYSYKVAQQYSNAMYRNWRSCSMQKYLTTLGCSSDSLRSSTSRSAIVKQAAKTLFTATSRLSNLPLKRKE